MSSVTFVYVNSSLDQSGRGSDDHLAEFTERHKRRLPVPPLERCSDITAQIVMPGLDGIVFEMTKGWADLEQIRLARSALNSRKRAWFYWPAESAVECVTHELLDSYRTLYLLADSFAFVRPALGFAGRFVNPVRALFRTIQSVASSSQLAEICLAEVQAIAANAAPIAFPGLKPPSKTEPLPGAGAYLRTDYWAPLKSGGSYGHTCYLANALAHTVHRLVCFSPTHYELLTALGLEQVVLPAPLAFLGERSLLSANAHYYPILKTAFSVLRPMFVYERLCLGNYTAARLSQELGIPYIVEYNGSEIEMNRSFDGHAFVHEAVYLKAEEAAFGQATIISVVSQPVKDDLVARGVDASKIIVNPNGVDMEAYAPAAAAEKAEIRRELGCDASQRLVGFIGTFGGWHGIDVLAKAIPQVCERWPEARFLLIGDGINKKLVDKAVREHNLESRVISRGQVPQREGARLLKACDIYISPHNKVMTGGRFFGSPTKLFEYMSLGGGIVASDLDQIGEVLTPALRARNLNGNRPAAGSVERAILCTPGNVDELVAGINYLVGDAQTCQTLGRNARKAAAEQFSWDCHIQRLWNFIGERNPAPHVRRMEGAVAQLHTGDAYKDEVQNQWNNNPCGSQYAEPANLHTVEWFKEIEAHRYQQYAPWMPETMEFAFHGGKKLLEVGAGLGTDLAQFALNGADVTDIDLSAGHLERARENFSLRGLTGRFIHQDAEQLPFDDAAFDVVYSNGVIHHTPNTASLVGEIYRVLKPGGRVIVMVYAENSLHYWGQQVFRLGLLDGQLKRSSIGEILSGNVEMTANDARPLVKVYTKERLRRLFRKFNGIEICQRQLTPAEMPLLGKLLPVHVAQKFMGWNLILKANKPS
jgi:glycosyltransferase involved in cell wall biosynthesis/ubiquinone/menaquinone biosynthesis C-methylase UbiE